MNCACVVLPHIKTAHTGAHLTHGRIFKAVATIAVAINVKCVDIFA